MSSYFYKNKKIIFLLFFFLIFYQNLISKEIIADINENNQIIVHEIINHNHTDRIVNKYTINEHLKKPLINQINEKYFNILQYLNRNFFLIYKLIPQKYLDNNFYYEKNYNGNLYIKVILQKKIMANYFILKIKSDSFEKRNIAFSIYNNENSNFMLLLPYKKNVTEGYDYFFFKADEIKEIKNIIIEINNYKLRKNVDLYSEIYFIEKDSLIVNNINIGKNFDSYNGIYYEAKNVLKFNNISILDKAFWDLDKCNFINKVIKNCEYIFNSKSFVQNKHEDIKDAVIEIKNDKINYKEKFSIKYDYYNKKNQIGILLIFLTFIYTKLTKPLLNKMKNKNKFYLIEFTLIFILQILFASFTLFVNYLFLILIIRFFENRIFKIN